MADLPSLEQVTTGGIVASVVGATAWLINKFRGAIDDGETLAERRIAALTSDFDAHRARVDEDRRVADAKIAQLEEEVHGYRSELLEADRSHRREIAEVRLQLRQCRADAARLQREVDHLRGDQS